MYFIQLRARTVEFILEQPQVEVSFDMDHWIIEWLRLEMTSGDHLVESPVQAGCLELIA